jgi:hypothetical protein
VQQSSSSVHMYQCINELWLYNSSNFALHYNYYNVSFKNIALKGYLTQRWMAITVSISQKKTFLWSVDPKQSKNVKFSLWSMIETFPRGGAWHFRRGATILRGGGKRSQGRCAPSPQNPAMKLSYILHEKVVTCWQFSVRHCSGWSHSLNISAVLPEQRQ